MEIIGLEYYQIMSLKNGTYNWQVPNTPTVNARIRVTDSENNQILDSSDSDFIIQEADPFIILYEPNGGEVFDPGDFTLVEWDSAFFGPNVKLEFSDDEGDTWNNIISSTPTASNSFSWMIPELPTSHGLLKISDSSNSNSSDISDDVFTINPLGVFVESPEGDDWVRCTSKGISWSARGSVGPWKVEYTLDGTLGLLWLKSILQLVTVGLFQMYLQMN